MMGLEMDNPWNDNYDNWELWSSNHWDLWGVFHKWAVPASHMRSYHPAQVELIFSRCHVGPKGPLDPHGCAPCEKTVVLVSIAYAVLSASTSNSDINIISRVDCISGDFATQLHLSCGIDRNWLSPIAPESYRLQYPQNMLNTMMVYHVHWSWKRTIEEIDNWNSETLQNRWFTRENPNLNRLCLGGNPAMESLKYHVFSHDVAGVRLQRYASFGTVVNHPVLGPCTKYITIQKSLYNII